MKKTPEERISEAVGKMYRLESRTRVLTKGCPDVSCEECPAYMRINSELNACILNVLQENRRLKKESLDLIKKTVI